MSTVLDHEVDEAVEPQSPAIGRLYEPEDLLRMPEEGRFELVDGRLVERKMGAESSRIAFRIMHRIESFIESSIGGVSFTTDCGYQIFPQHPKRVRYPDGSYIQSGRLSGDVPPKGHVRIVPDFVVEVVSPNDLAEEVNSKIVDYRSVGVPLIWVVYPESRTVDVYRLGKQFETFGVDDTITGDDVLPGFSCRVAEFFPSPVANPQEQPQEST